MDDFHDLLERLDAFDRWRVERYTQGFEDGKIKDPIWECQLMVDELWMKQEFSNSAMGAVKLALEKAEEKRREEK